MADAAASKAAEATHVGSTPTFPIKKLGIFSVLTQRPKAKEPSRTLDV
jgi:hypothetical protein